MKEKRKLGCWWFAIIPLLLIALFLLQLMGPSPALVVSPQTTHITTPLGVDGMPDYVAHWHVSGQEGVTPENNAAVLIWKATWPGELSPEHYDLICEALGMEVPSTADALVSIYDKSVLGQVSAALLPDLNEDAEITPEDIVQMASERPWSTKQLPMLAEWAELNKGPLDLLVEGANRPKYYSPSPSFLEGKDTPLVAILLPGIQGLRNAARCLIARAMWNIGEQRPMEAWRDLRATHLIARHAYRGKILVEHLVGAAIESMACSGTQTLLHHGDLSREQAERILADLKALSQAPPIMNAIDEGERLMFLDTTMRIATGKISGADLQNFGGPVEGAASVVASTRIDWNAVMRKGNAWYDRLVEAGKLPRAQRLVEMDKIDVELNNLGPTNPTRLVGGIVSGGARSELVADTMLMLFVPALGAATNAGDRAAIQLELTRVAAALAVFRAANDEYPEDLIALVPDCFEVMPLDLFSGKPFLYERREDGYLLYSVFENGVDDKGMDFGGRIVAGEWVSGDPQSPDRDKSDLVVRLPRPDIRLPK